MTVSLQLCISMAFSLFFLVIVTTRVGSQTTITQGLNNDDSLRNMLLVDDSVIVGSSTNIYRLNSSKLEILNSINVTGLNRLLISVEDTGLGGDVLSCQKEECILLDSTSLAKTSVSILNSIASVLIPGDQDLTGVATSNTSLFIARENFVGDSNNRIASSISKLTYTPNSEELELSLVGNQVEGDLFTERRFLTVFKTEKYVYHMYDLVDRVVDATNNLRISRTCVTDPGSGGSLGLATFTEAILKCTGVSSETVSSATTVTIDGHLMVLINLFTESNNNEICSFNVSMINEAMDNHLEMCKNGDGLLGLKRSRSMNNNCPSLSESQKLLVTPCDRSGVLAVPLEVDSPLVGSSLISFDSQVAFSSLTTVIYENITYVIAGTQGGIEQFHYSDDSALVHIRNVTLTSSLETISEIQISDDREFYYGLSNQNVARHPLDVCNQLTSCQLCVESMDPLCGWCTLTSTCSKLNDCVTSPQIWAVDDDDCPVIDSVEPSFFYTHQLNDTSLYFTINYRSVPNVTYNCVYDFTTTTQTKMANIISNDTITCSLPSTNGLPTFGEEDTLSAQLFLRTVSSSVDIVGGESVEFTNCSTQSTCFDCLSSTNKCMWCPVSLGCRSELQQCPDGEVAVNGTSPEDHCPFLQTPLNNDNYLVHNFLDQKLVLRARNLRNLNSECVIEDIFTGVEYTLEVINSTDEFVICNRTFFNVSLTASNPVLEANVFIRVNDIPIENPSGTKVIFYSCPLMGENCGHCLSIQDQFNCVYCKDAAACLLDNICAAENTLRGIGDFGGCELPKINSFYPKAGPLQGNTTITIEGLNLGADSSQVLDIRIRDVKCKHIPQSYLPGRRIRCITDETTTAIFSNEIELDLLYGTSSTFISFQQYSFLIPKLDVPPVRPSLGPLAGGTLVTVEGSHLGIGSSRSVTMAGQPCEIQNPELITDTITNITCITSNSSSTTVRGEGAVVVRIDGYTETALGFDYDNNPTFSSISPLFSFQSGGTVLTVRGKDLDTVQRPQLLFYDVSQNRIQKRDITDSSSIYSNPESSPCEDNFDSDMKCLAPQLSNKNGTSVVVIGLMMDNVRNLLILENVNITVFTDPIFDTGLNFEIQPGQSQNLTLTGEGFHFSLAQVEITVQGVSTNCVPKKITDQSEVVCEIEIGDNVAEGQYTIQVKIGNYVRNVGMLAVDQQLNQLIIIISVFAALVVVVIVIFIVSFSVFYRKYKQKEQQKDLLLLELDRLESSMAHECKLGFAELQTDVDELTGDLSGSRLPYHDFYVYLLQSLFPGAKDHPVLHELQLHPQKKIQTERALKDFNQIVLNKTALLTIIQALEGQRAFTIRDKSNMGSLLMLALHNKLDYATDILKSLLSTLVRKTVADSYPKLLLRRTESVAEKMLSSWLAFTLHGYVMEHTGQPLYRLFKAVKAQLEKGPIDVVTGEARYSLSEQKLIRQQINVTVINATVETEDGLQIPVKLLDCDSVSQAKEKMLDAVHKNAPVTQRPSLTAIDIEYRRAPKEDGLILRDEDGGNDMEAGWRKINTLAHYWIPDRAVFRLVSRREKPIPGRVFDYTGSLMVTHGYRNRSISDAEDGWRVWHLFKQHEEDPRSSPFMSKKMVTEIYLPRMLSTKTILQSFVDSLFNSIFTLSQPPISPSQLYTPINATFSPISAEHGYAPGTDSLPVPIKYLFDFLDDEATCAKISDTDVLHTWKNNSLALRFWVNLIKNPEFVFDINKSAIVDSCLSVIAQAFIDGCSSSDAKPTINSPTSKLLFNKEVQGYKTNVKKYYEQISELPRIPEDMMQSYLRDLSTYQSQLIENTGGFHTESALNEIMRYCIKYKEPILESLRASNLDSEASLLESAIHRSM